MNKAEYRQYFRMMQKYVKLTVICREAGIHVSNFSKFLKDETGRNDWCISIDKLNILRNACEDTLSKIV